MKLIGWLLLVLGLWLAWPALRGAARWLGEELSFYRWYRRKYGRRGL